MCVCVFVCVCVCVYIFLTMENRLNDGPLDLAQPGLWVAGCWFQPLGMSLNGLPPPCVLSQFRPHAARLAFDYRRNSCQL